jgi:hypothetical protein
MTRTLLLPMLLALALLPRPARGHSDDLCAETDHCATAAQCNDGDPCTRDTCEAIGDTDGCCEHEPLPGPCLDTFLCYDVAPPASFTPIADVRVVDPDGRATVTLTATRQLCSPADRDRAGFHDARTHLERYGATPGIGSVVADVKVETALGAVLVDVATADSVLVAASGGSVLPAAAPARNAVDDLVCHAVTPAATAPPFPRRLQTTLANGLTGPPTTFRVAAPVELCTAADAGGDGFADTCAAVLCYRVKRVGSAPRFFRTPHVWARDRFALRELEALKETVACLPAVVNDHSCSPRGFFCERDADCTTGHCAGGVCCESACDGPCQSCTAGTTGQPHGTCAPVPGCS